MKDIMQTVSDDDVVVDADHERDYDHAISHTCNTARTS